MSRLITKTNVFVLFAQKHQLDLKLVLVPILVVVAVAVLLLGLAYKYWLRRVLNNVCTGTEKKAPPAGGDREVTLVLTDVQVGGG